MENNVFKQHHMVHLVLMTIHVELLPIQQYVKILFALFYHMERVVQLILSVIITRVFIVVQMDCVNAKQTSTGIQRHV